MKFVEINITDSGTVVINTAGILFVEKSPEGLAALTLMNGEKYRTNEDYDELIESL